ncbi:MAG: hypothetical protein ACT4TC_07395, partial [Myxococcaceae bacterium]
MNRRRIFAPPRALVRLDATARAFSALMGFLSARVLIDLTERVFSALTDSRMARPTPFDSARRFPSVMMRRLDTVLALLLFFSVSCRGNLGLDSGRAYPCTADGPATQCPETWRCGLDSRCHSSDPGPYVCSRANANTDCEGGWLCGLDEQCHAPDVPADYACQIDTDCVGGWRCGPEGRCVDANADRLVTGAAELSLTGTQINPLLVTERPAFYATSSASFVIQNRGSTAWRLIAFTRPNALRIYLIENADRVRIGSSQEVSLNGRSVKALAIARNTVMVGHDQGVTFHKWGDGQNNEDGLQPPVTVADVEATFFAVHSESVAYAVSGRNIATLDPAARAYERTMVGPDGGVVTALGQHQTTLVVSTAGGVWTASELRAGLGEFFNPDGGPNLIGDPEWRPMSTRALPNPACANADGGVHMTRFLPGSDPSNVNTFFAELSGSDGGVVSVARLAPNYQPGADQCAPAAVTQTLQVNACVPCPAGTTYRDVFVSRTTDNGGSDRIEVRCARTDGVEDTYRLEINTQADGGTWCQRGNAGDSVLTSDTLKVMSDEARYAQGDYGRGALFGKHGQVWVLRGSTEKGLALEADRPVNGLTTCQDVGEFALSLTENVFRSPGAIPGAGLGISGDYATNPADALPQAAVDGKACWLVGSQANTVFVGRLDAVNNGALTVLASTGPTSQVLPPFHSSAATTSDGGTTLLVSVGDLLMATELGGEGVQKLETRVSPAARSPILSFATFPTTSLESSDGLLAGYVLSESGLTSFQASSPQRWRSEAMTLPDGTWQEVWAEGRAGRVGYADGRVISVPSRVQIAPAIPGGRAFDFVQLCGATFALSPQGLFQLRAPTEGPIGSWSAVTGATLPPADQLKDLGGVTPKLYVSAGKLYVMGVYGQTL